MGKVHLYGGICIVIVFILTGQYMHHSFGHLSNMEPMSRALFRAGHLYILLFGLINVALGVNFKLSAQKHLAFFQKMGSVIVWMASVLIIYAFFKELPSDDIERPITRICLYMILLGISLHGLVFLFIQNKKEL